MWDKRNVHTGVEIKNSYFHPDSLRIYYFATEILIMRLKLQNLRKAMLFAAILLSALSFTLTAKAGGCDECPAENVNEKTAAVASPFMVNVDTNIILNERLVRGGLL